MTRTDVHRVDAREATAQIADGRLTMDASDREEPVLRVRIPERQPLTCAEEHAELVITGDEFSATVSLDKYAREGLRAALEVEDE